MTRIDRLELVVRNLADRVLGEEYTFDAIAEQEAAEQGVAYVPVAQAPAVPDVSEALAPLAERLAALESARAPVASELPDLSPILEAITHLADRVAAVEQNAPSVEPSAFDPEPLVLHIAALQDRHAALSKQVMAIETYLQEILQHVEDHAQKLAAHRQELDVIETFPAFETEGAKRKAG
jgi:chromosome segregation ATPase